MNISWKQPSVEMDSVI